MKKIYPIAERLVSIFTIVLLSVVSIILFAKHNDEIFFVVIAWTCIIFIVLAVSKLSFVSSQIIIENNRIKVFDFPLFATNKFYDKKRSLILWNNEIDINEIEKIELITLTKDEQNEYIGYKHLFNEYLKFNLKYGHSKYVYIGNYSKSQIRKMINLLTSKSISNTGEDI